MYKWPRTLIFTTYAPPSSAAAAQIFERLISGVEERFGFVYQEDCIPRQATTWVDAPVNNAFGALRRLPVLWRFDQFGWYHAAIREGLNLATKSKWDVILACHPDVASALAAARVAQIKKLPLVLYLHNLFAESRVNPVEKIWAKVSEKELLKQASTVICLTEGLQKYYSHKYNIRPVFLPHCVTETEIAEAVQRRPNLKVGPPLTLTYAGGVYQARLDSLVVVKQAVDKLNAQGYPTQLLILGKNDPAQLNTWGIGGSYVRVRFVKDRTEFMDTLRHSDILLSTVAFKSAYPLQDQTCFPTKTFDYFLAGKPVLLIAPENSDYFSYMRKHRCALTIGTLEINCITSAIRQLAANTSFRKDLVDAGFSRLGEHCTGLLQSRFFNILSRL